MRDVAFQSLDAFAYLRSVGIAHRDMNPSSIMEASDVGSLAQAASHWLASASDLARWRVLLADFSRSRALQTQRRLREKAPYF